MTDKQRVVCQHCNGVVGVPAGRLADGPRCPKCHTPLFDGHPIELGDHNFDQHVASERRAGGGGFLGAVVRAVPDDGTGVRRDGEPDGAGRTVRQAQH